jgi:hypothetical protein
MSFIVSLPFVSADANRIEDLQERAELLRPSTSVKQVKDWHSTVMKQFNAEGGGGGASKVAGSKIQKQSLKGFGHP